VWGGWQGGEVVAVVGVVLVPRELFENTLIVYGSVFTAVI